MTADSVLDALPKPVAVIASDLTVSRANAAFTARFGDLREAQPVSARLEFWQRLSGAVQRLQPAGRTTTFRWVDGDEPEPTPFDVRVVRLEREQFLLVADDVSPYVQAQIIQGSVREYLERVLNRLDRALIVLDAGLHVTMFNRAQADLWVRLGRADSPVDVIGAPVASAYTVLAPEEWALVSTELRAGRDVHRPKALTLEDGRVLDLEVRPLQEPGQPVIGAICLTGERPDAASAGALEAREREELLARLAHALAHEINNPLTTILGTADALLASAALAPPTRKRLDAIRTSALKIADAVRRLAVQP